MGEVPAKVITRSRLVADLRGLDLCAGQVVMLHASVKAIGWVVGGPDVVIQALLDVLTSEGTLMMLVSWEDSPYELPEWPKERQQAYLDECPPFDPARSRAFRAWSILTEYLRTWPGACRSANPDKSFAAVGKHARMLTENHHLSYGYGPDSPLGRLCELNGKVLLLGSPLADVTLLHLSEHIARVPDKPVVHYRMPILRNGSRQWVEVEEFDTNRPIGPGEDYFEAIMTELLASGQGKWGKVGMADSYLFDAATLSRFAIAWLERTFGSGTG